MHNFDNAAYIKRSFHQHESFKQKLMEEGTRLSGRIGFWYLSSDFQITARAVDPVAYYETVNEKYFLGFCHLRKELRIFNMGGAWDVRDACSGAGYDTLFEWISENAGKESINFGEPTEEEIEKLTRVPALPTPDQAFDIGSQLVQEFMRRANGRWLVTQVTYESDPGFYINVRGIKKDGSIAKTVHSFVRFIDRDVTYSIKDGCSIEISTRHRPRPWELRKGTKLIARVTTVESLKNAWLPLLRI